MYIYMYIYVYIYGLYMVYMWLVYMAYKPLSNWDPNGPVGAPPAV